MSDEYATRSAAKRSLPRRDREEAVGPNPRLGQCSGMTPDTKRERAAGSSRFLSG